MPLVPRLLLAATLALAAPAAGWAQVQPAPQAEPGTAPRPDGSRPQARNDNARSDARRESQETRLEGRHLPPDATTEHVLDLPGRQLKFKAVAGSLPLVDPQGQVQAELGTVAYLLDGADPATRPVTFALNGGPGASSAYLQLGPIGPWRLPVSETQISPSQATALMPNAETWLDFTDLVFIDPVDTGYSRAAGSREEVRDRYMTIDGDVASITAAIARWLRTNDRLGAPKFYIGESYGGFRGPLIARKLQTEIGIGLSGMVLLSPVLDFSFIGQPRHAPMEFVTRLPSLAASALEKRGPVSRDALAEVERYATGDYLADLLKGVNDNEAVDRMSRRVAELTGLDPALVRQRGGRLDLGTVARELRRADGRVVSFYDTGASGYDPDPTSPRSEADDPVLNALTAPLTSAMIDHLARNLNWRVPNARYELLNESVSGRWRYGGSRRAPQVVDDLKQALAFDPKLRVMVAHGLTDLVTPYFTDELILRQIPRYGADQRLTLATYPGGHMFYFRDASRAAFRADAQRMFEAALKARAN